MIMKKHKIFCSYAFTGEDKLKVEARMRRVVDLLEGCGHEVYCNLFDGATESYGSPRQFLRRAIDQMNECDKILVIQTSPRRSEGMLIEIGVAMARDKSILLAQHQSAASKSYLPDLARRTQTWHSESELDAAIITLIKSDCD